MDRRALTLALALALIPPSSTAFAQATDPDDARVASPTDVMVPPPNVLWSVASNVTACPAGDSVVAGHPARLRITLSYVDSAFHVKNGVPPESIWAFVKPISGNVKVNDETADDFGPLVYADDSTRGGAARITVPSFSGCGTVKVTLWVSGVPQGFKNANVRTVDTNADANRRVTTADQTGYCDLNYDGSSNATDLALVTAHLNHWHHNTLYGTLVRRTNLCESCNGGEPNTIGSGDISWSPDGATLAFSSHNASGNCSLKLVASDGSGGNTVTEITNPPAGVEDYDPSWSPLGDYVFWDRDDAAIYKKDPSSPSNPDILVFESSANGMLAATEGSVSPDGQQFVFVGIASGGGGYLNVFKIRTDGTGLTALAPTSNVQDSWPKWSTDGQTIVFYRYDFSIGRTSIWKVPAAGGTATQILAPATNASFPAYSPDDSIIVCGIGVSGSPVTNTFDPALGLSAPPIQAYPGYSAFLFSPRFASDGTRLALIARTPGVPTSYQPQLWATRRNMSRPPSINTLGGQAVVNAAPVLNFTAIPGTALNLVVSATDPEGDAISYFAYSMRTDLGMSFNPGTKTFTWNAPVTASDSVYFVRFQVTTFSGGSDYAIARITVADRMPPAQITDLTPTMGHTTAVLTWTSPGDNGNVGNCTAFDLRYAQFAINDGNFGSATQVPTNAPAPQGQLNCGEVSGLTPCAAYWFAVKAVDDAGNWSFVSNVPNAAPTCSGSLEFACASPQDGSPPRPKGTIELPKSVELAVRGPNPTRSPLDIAYGIPQERAGQELRMSVFDVAGRRLLDLREGRAVAGRFTTSWDLRDQTGRRVPAGFYLLRFGVGPERLTHSVLVLP